MLDVAKFYYDVEGDPGKVEEICDEGLLQSK